MIMPLGTARMDMPSGFKRDQHSVKLATMVIPLGTVIPLALKWNKEQ